MRHINPPYLIMLGRSLRSTPLIRNPPRHRANGTGNFDEDQGAMMRGCNDYAVVSARPLFLTSGWGTKCASSAAVRCDGPDDSPAQQTVGVIRQSRRFPSISRRLCCECARGRLAAASLFGPVLPMNASVNQSVWATQGPSQPRLPQT